MVPNFELTVAESESLAEARKLLGDNLANFLLSGIGESGIAHRRHFTAQCKPSHGDEITYQLELINDSELGLPIAREPLVLAALLDFLWERQPLNSTILFRQSDILEKLEWNDDAESQSLIKRALERYVFTAYCLVDPTSTEEESLSSGFVSIGRLLTGFEMASPLHPLKKRGQLKYAAAEPLYACAHFLPGLIHDVISERKSFLGIDFQKLQFVPNPKET
jgi:hypothetical protein